MQHHTRGETTVGAQTFQALIHVTFFAIFLPPPPKKKKLCSKITIGSKYNDTKIIQSSYGHPKLLNLQSVSIAYRGIEKYHNWTIPQCYVVRI